jgi:hypothetical protein
VADKTAQRVVAAPTFSKVDGFNFFETLWYGRSWPRSDEKEENQVCLEKRILIPVQNTNESVLFFRSRMGTPCTAITITRSITCRFHKLHS